MLHRYVLSHDDADILMFSPDVPEEFRDGYGDAILHHIQGRCFLADAIDYSDDDGDFWGGRTYYALGYQAACRELSDRARETHECCHAELS